MTLTSKLMNVELSFRKRTLSVLELMEKASRAPRFIVRAYLR